MTLGGGFYKRRHSLFRGNGLVNSVGVRTIITIIFIIKLVTNVAQT